MSVAADRGPRDAPPTVLIAGCGDLGTEVGLRFVARGWRAVGLRRRAHVLPAALVPLAGDLTGDLAEAVEQLPNSIEAVVITPAADERTPAAYRAAYVDGLTNVLDHLDRSDRTPARLLAVSSTAVYGVDDGSDVDEDTPTAPTSPTGAVLVEAEQVLHRRRPDAVSLRLSGIYGPGRTRLIDRVRSGQAVLPDPPALSNRIHRDDAAAAIVHLLTATAAPERLYLGVDDAPVDRGEVLAFLAQELGLPRPPTGPDRSTRGGDKRCRNDRLKATGFRFTYPTYREGYRAILAGDGIRHP
ncbi:MAG: SDR family oxidoreductase [Nitriliruptor sp.]|nr:MAG: SDR family oxidoreductase [Nitriliruptor sp.]